MNVTNIVIILFYYGIAKDKTNYYIREWLAFTHYSTYEHIGIAKFLDIYDFTIATVKSNADTVIILLSDKSSVVVA